jgi:N-acetylglucosaminyldiphosphoundecaprenol N-acetyl-beta-D-mannosaminyltransferase
MTAGIRTHSIFAVRVHNAPYEQLLAAARAAAYEPRPTFTTYSHFDVLLNARGKPWLHALLNRAALNVGDGIAVRLALHSSGVPRPAAVNATDFHHALLNDSLRTGKRVFLLGGSEAAEAALPANLLSQYPNCTVQVHHGQISVDDPAVLEAVSSFAPDVLFLGLGSPLQFEWIDRNLEALRIPLTAATGNFMEFLAGTRPRAPRWMRATGLEWLHRLLHEPARLWRRYLLGIPCFAYLVIAERIFQRTTR